jgi:hypothetical protein
MFRFFEFIKIFCFNSFNFFYFCPIRSLYSIKVMQCMKLLELKLYRPFFQRLKK